MKPLNQPARPVAGSAASVASLLRQLEHLCETFGLDALNDESLAPVAAALADAADVAGRWLVDRGAEGRRAMPSEAVAMAAALEPFERAAAAERQKSHGGTAPGRNTGGNFTPVSTGKARDKVADAVGMSAPPPAGPPWDDLFSAVR